MFDPPKRMQSRTHDLPRNVVSFLHCTPVAGHHVVVVQDTTAAARRQSRHECERAACTQHTAGCQSSSPCTRFASHTRQGFVVTSRTSCATLHTRGTSTSCERTPQNAARAIARHVGVRLHAGSCYVRGTPGAARCGRPASLKFPTQPTHQHKCCVSRQLQACGTAVLGHGWTPPHCTAAPTRL